MACPGQSHAQEAKTCDNSGGMIVTGFRVGLLDSSLMSHLRVV